MSAPFFSVKRAAAGILCVLLLLVPLFSALTLASEAAHDCCGDDCLVCVCLRHCEALLRQGGGKAAAPAAAGLCAALLPALLLLSAPVFAQETPVSQKRRLNN